MGAVTEYYVDPASGDDADDGSIGTPWATVQHALDNITRNATNGDRINIKAGGTDTLAADLSTASFGSWSYTAPLIIQGYTSSAGDGGIGKIDFNGANSFTAGTSTGTKIVDMELTGSTDSIGIALYDWSELINCYLHDFSTDATQIRENCLVLGCRFEDIGGRGIYDYSPSGRSGAVQDCFFANGTKSFSTAVEIENYSSTIERNIFSLSGASNAIKCRYFNQICHNSILSSAGTGTGVKVNNVGFAEAVRLWSNLVEGFSGVGGIGIDYHDDATLSLNNSVYNCATNFSGNAIHCEAGNESLGSSPFAKSGSLTFVNRFTYFEPNDVGSVRGGAYGNSTLDRGAVQHTASGGSGGGNKVTRFIMGAM